MNRIYADLPTTIFEVMSGLARETGAINLGQGFPDEPGPLAVREKAAEASISGWNQYPPMRGLAELRQAVADHYRRFQGVDLEWAEEVTVTSGATEALAASIFALITPGDEVVLFQPLYDAYAPLIRRAGGAIRLARLEPPHWRLSREMLEAVFTPNTRLVVFNNPLNPSGTAFAREDLELLAEFCVRHDAVIISDEVWEQVVFDGRRHVSVLNLPALRDRAVKIGSAGKMFALTGWKVGFVCAPPALSQVIAKAHQFLTFTTAPNLQAAVAWGLHNSEAWFEQMPLDLQRSRDRLAQGLRREGFAVLDSSGTYFLNIDLPGSGIDLDDRTFSMRAVREAGVASIPVSSFYETDPVTSVVRLCFAKADETLDLAIERLSRARDLFRSGPD